MKKERLTKLEKEIASFDAKKEKQVKAQIEASSISGNDVDAYWDNANNKESVFANPDSLTDELHNKPWGNSPPKLARLLIEEYMNEQGEFDILSAQENQALRLYTSGLSLGEVAREMKVSKSTIVVYIGRISIKFRKLLAGVKGTL